MTSKLKTHIKHFMIGSLIAALGAGTYVIAAVTFSDFTTGTAISSSEMNAKLNALKGAVNTNVTRLNYNGEITDTTISFTYETFRTVGSFTKAAGDTAIELTWNSHASMAGTFCDFQLRVGNVADSTDTGRAVVYGTEVPVSVTTYFSGLAAGAHSVSIWVRGSATSCRDNLGNFTRTVFVKEIPVSATSTTLALTAPSAAVSQQDVQDGVPAYQQQ